MDGLMNGDERTGFLEESEGERRAACRRWPAALVLLAGVAASSVGVVVLFAKPGGGKFLSPAAAVSAVQGFSTGSSLRLGPPWWIIHNVKPAGPDKNMGSWTAITFSKEQQERFGVDEDGKVLDAEKFDGAVADLGNEKVENLKDTAAVAAMPPWWILDHVKPAGQARTAGSSTVAAFSEEQQDRFGVDRDGAVVNATRFKLARAALGSGAPAAEDCAGGPPKGSKKCTLIVVFSKDTGSDDMEKFIGQFGQQSGHSQILRSLRDVILEYDQVDQCCSTYQQAWREAGVVSVEFDQVVEALGPGGGGSGAAMSVS